MLAFEPVGGRSWFSLTRNNEVMIILHNIFLFKEHRWIEFINIKSYCCIFTDNDCVILVKIYIIILWLTANFKH